MNYIDRILREKAALVSNLVCLERLSGSGNAATASIERAIESVRDAIEALDRAVDESQN